MESQQALKSLDGVLSAKIEELKKKNLLRVLNNDIHEGIYVIRNGKKLLSFCSNDYLGLSQNSDVIKASIDATMKYGSGAGASRLVTGNSTLYNELEVLLADMKHTEAACVFGSGYLANIGVIPSIVGRGDIIIADKLAHSCIHDGIRLSGAKLMRFKHNDMENLAAILQKHRCQYKNCLIITETVFSMDGDISPVSEIATLAKENNAWFMTDDAHGFGVVDNSINADIQMGTLSKAAGCYGGYICASKTIIDYIKTSAKSLIYSTALPLGVIASAIAACEIIRDDRILCLLPIEKAKLFTKTLGINEAKSAIVPMVLGSEEKALCAEKKLEDAGFLVTAIRPPTVPHGTSRLRFTFSALHKDEDVKCLAEVINRLEEF